MATIELDGKAIGRRTIDAIVRAAQEGPIAVSMDGAHIRDELRFDGITFSDFWAQGAAFDHGVGFADCVFGADLNLRYLRAPRLSLRGVRAASSAYFVGAQVAAVEIHGSAFADYASFDNAAFHQLTMRGVRFAAEARFRDVSVRSHAKLRRVVFESVVGLNAARGERSDSKDAHSAARFTPRSAAHETSCRGSAVECLIPASSIAHERLCGLRGTTFTPPLNLRLDAPTVVASSSSFEQGLDLTLSQGAHLDLSNASRGDQV